MKAYTPRMYAKLIEKVYRNEDITKQAHRLFLYLLNALDSREFTIVSQRHICAELFLDKSTMSKAFAVLVDNDILESSTDQSNRKYYRFKIN